MKRIFCIVAKVCEHAQTLPVMRFDREEKKIFNKEDRKNWKIFWKQDRRVQASGSLCYPEKDVENIEELKTSWG